MARDKELFDAFRAGFDLKAEANDVWIADDEWLYEYFCRWKEKQPLPQVCNVREQSGEPSWLKSPPCLRPRGHDGTHDWDTGKQGSS